MLTQLAGKPFAMKLDGRARNIGKISDARVSPDRSKLYVAIDLTDETAAGILGAAQDKALATTETVKNLEGDME